MNPHRVQGRSVRRRVRCVPKLTFLGRTKAGGCGMNVAKAQIVAILRSRGLDTRADWADRTLPDIVDTATNAGLLKTLGIAAESLQPAAAAPRPSGADHP